MQEKIEITGIEEFQDFLESCEPGTVITVVIEDEDDHGPAVCTG